jgi:hypothetical protein
MEGPSRLEATRRRLRLARYGVVAVSAAAFGGLAFVARAAHLGTSSPASSSSGAVSQSTSSADDDSQSQSFGDFGSSSIGPSNGSTPSIQSGGS